MMAQLKREQAIKSTMHTVFDEAEDILSSLDERFEKIRSDDTRKMEYCTNELSKATKILKELEDYLLNAEYKEG